MRYLFYHFTQRLPTVQTYDGFQLLACDGSDLNISYDPDDWESCKPSGNGKRGSNQLHLHALYDLCNKKYETYHVFAHIMAKGLAFVIRTKDISRKGGIAYGFRLPDRELDKDGKQAVYPMKLRMVRFLLDTGEYECIVTNLKREEFPPWRIRELYHLRGGICAFLSPIH